MNLLTWVSNVLHKQCLYLLIIDYLFSIAFADMRGFAFNLRAPPRQSHQAGPSRLAPSTPTRPQQQQASPAPPRQRERPVVGEKRQRPGEEPSSENRRPAEFPSLTVASGPTIREEENCQRRCGETGQSSDQRGASTAAEADLTSIIEQLPSHLRSMVSLLARTVTPSVEGRMMEKRGKIALKKAAIMMVVISHSLF